MECKYRGGGYCSIPALPKTDKYGNVYCFCPEHRLQMEQERARLQALGASLLVTGLLVLTVLGLQLFGVLG